MVGSFIEYYINQSNQNPEFNSLFLDILKLDETHILREKLIRETENLMNRFLRYNEINSLPNDIDLRIIRILAKKNPRWLYTNRIVVEKLSKIIKLQE